MAAYQFEVFSVIFITDPTSHVYVSSHSILLWQLAPGEQGDQNQHSQYHMDTLTG